MKNWRRHLQYGWWKYVAILVIPIILWSLVFSALGRIKPNERVNILILGEGVDCKALQSHLEQKIDQLTDQTIISIKVDSQRAKGEYFHQKMIANSIDYDIIVATEQEMPENFGQSYFYPMREIDQPGYENVTYYTEEIEDYTKTYGIELLDANQTNLFGTFYSGTGKCYAFFTTDTVNIYPVNQNSQPGNDAALKVLAYLLQIP